MSETMQGTGLWAVLDKNARGGKRRVHEMADGKHYALDANEPTHMPKGHALMFLRDESFQVMDEHGHIQNTLPSSEVSGERKVTELESDQCVARYDELTTAALQARVAIRPGGSSIDSTAPREALIAFLLEAPARADERPENRVRSGGEDDAIDRGNSAFKRLPSLEEQLSSVPVRAAANLSAGFGA